MNWKTHVTVAAVVEYQERFLMVQEHASGALVLNQPAGHLEADESLTDAVARETLEETAWQFKPESVLGVYHWQQPHRQRTYLRFAFCGRLAAHDTARELDEGIVAALWLSRRQLEKRIDELRSPMVMQCVDDYLDGRRYPLEILTYLDQQPMEFGMLARMR